MLVLNAVATAFRGGVALESAVHHRAHRYQRMIEAGDVSSADQHTPYVADAADSGQVWATA